MNQAAAAAIENLEAALTAMFDRPAVAVASPALVHLAALPHLVRNGDVVLLEEHASAYLRAAVDLITESGKALVETVSQRNLAAALARHGRSARTWFVADGVREDNGARVDAELLNRMAQRYPHLRLYIDDTHGIGWFGVNGTGVVFEVIEDRDRLYLTFATSQAFNADGAAIIAPDTYTAQTLRSVTASRLFHAPVEMLESAAGGAWRALSLFAEDDRLLLLGVIQNFITACDAHGVSLADRSESPVFQVRTARGLDRVVLHAGMRTDEVTELVDDLAYAPSLARIA